jgi:hypothetical protein
MTTRAEHMPLPLACLLSRLPTPANHVVQSSQAVQLMNIAQGQLRASTGCQSKKSGGHAGLSLPPESRTGTPLGHGLTEPGLQPTPEMEFPHKAELHT